MLCSVQKLQIPVGSLQMAAAGAPVFEKYQLGHKDCGKVLIINLCSFHSDLQQPDREGSEVDVERLHRTFQKLGFKPQSIETLKNPNYEDIIKTIREVAGKDNTDDMFVCVMMTHGGKMSGTFCAWDKEFNSSELWDPFSSSFENKPKVFIFQTCRGNLIDDGVKVKWSPKSTSKPTMMSDYRVDGGGESAPLARVHRDSRFTPSGVVRQFTDKYYPVNLNPAHQIPDMLIAYSTLEPFCSFLTKNGSPFIQTLCDKLEKFHSSEHLLHILTRVNAHMSTEVESKVKDPYRAEYDKAKQMSCVTSTFSQLLLFNCSSSL